MTHIHTYAEKVDFVVISTPNKQLTLQLRAVPLLHALKKLLEEVSSQQMLRKLLDLAKEEEEEKDEEKTTTSNTGKAN